MWKRVIRQRERIRLVRVEAHEVAPEVDLAAEGVHGHRWWTLAELEATGEVVYPERLAALLADLLEHGAPPQPIDAGR